MASYVSFYLSSGTIILVTLKLIVSCGIDVELALMSFVGSLSPLCALQYLLRLCGLSGRYKPSHNCCTISWNLLEPSDVFGV